MSDLETLKEAARFQLVPHCDYCQMDQSVEGSWVEGEVFDESITQASPVVELTFNDTFIDFSVISIRIRNSILLFP